MPSISHSGLNSYLMGRAAITYQHIITCWLSVVCLFDGYLIEALLSSIGHSIRHFVLYGYSVLKMYFYRTLSQLKSAKSYLMVKLKNLASHILNNCISAICLFDGYLTEVHCKSYKTPKLLDKSGFFPPLPLGQRDMSKVAILNI